VPQKVTRKAELMNESINKQLTINLRAQHVNVFVLDVYVARAELERLKRL